MQHRLSLIGIVALLLVASPHGASAHAALDHAEPKAGNKLAIPPQEVTLSFTEKLEPAFSTITVTNAAGAHIETGKAQVEGSRMSIPVRSGGSGTYHVDWRVLSVDSHRTKGSYTFEVGQ